jgi:hypothetical protein
MLFLEYKYKMSESEFEVRNYASCGKKAVNNPDYVRVAFNHAAETNDLALFQAIYTSYMNNLNKADLLDIMDKREHYSNMIETNPTNYAVTGTKRSVNAKSCVKPAISQLEPIPPSCYVTALQCGAKELVNLMMAHGIPATSVEFEQIRADQNKSGYATMIMTFINKDFCRPSIGQVKRYTSESVINKVYKKNC